MTSIDRIIVAGGGAAGFFAAIAAAEIYLGGRGILLGRSAQGLSKGRGSGGGRCNVTHAGFDPAELVTHYPRGGAALRGPLTRFQPRDTVEWFESRGVPLKTEPDNRIFPKSDQSETIIQCLKAEAARVGVQVRVNARIDNLAASPTPLFRLHVGADVLECDRLILATGSNPHGWEWARALGHSLVPPVPSL